MPPCFLLVGLSWDQVTALLGPEKAPAMIESTKQLLAKGEEDFVDAGLEYKMVNYGPEESMDRLEGILGERDWSGVCIGFGIRSIPPFTPLFERLVNTIHEKSPKTKMLFNTTPDNTMEAVKRWFSVP